MSLEPQEADTSPYDPRKLDRTDRDLDPRDPRTVKAHPHRRHSKRLRSGSRQRGEVQESDDSSEAVGQ